MINAGLKTGFYKKIKQVLQIALSSSIIFALN